MPWKCRGKSSEENIFFKSPLWFHVKFLFLLFLMKPKSCTLGSRCRLTCLPSFKDLHYICGSCCVIVSIFWSRSVACACDPSEAIEVMGKK